VEFENLRFSFQTTSSQICALLSNYFHLCHLIHQNKVLWLFNCSPTGCTHRAEPIITKFTHTHTHTQSTEITFAWCILGFRRTCIWCAAFIIKQQIHTSSIFSRKYEIPIYLFCNSFLILDSKKGFWRHYIRLCLCVYTPDNH